MGLIDEARRLGHARDRRGRSWTPRTAEPWREPAPVREFPTSWARTPVAGAVRAGLQRGLLTPATWTVTAPHVEGVEYLEETPGPLVFLANHASHLDTALVLGSLPRPIARRLAVAAAADYFFDRRWRGMLTALAINGFPVERIGRGSRPALAVDLVRDGWNLLLFPEGTRSPDGWMTTVRRGGAYLCCGLGVPAVPVALRGTYDAMPRGSGWVRPSRPRVTVRYGRPLLPGDAENPRDFNERLVTALARLWVEEDVGWYSARRLDAGAVRAVATGPEPSGTSWRRRWTGSRPLQDPAAGTAWRS